MFEMLFGTELPLPVRFFLAFLVVLGLIGATAWAVRRFGTGRLGGASSRGRQPRLGVIDYASVDARRRLILVRRDNVEHLLMIGGPTDVVVEANIVRAVAASRDVPMARPPAVENLPRAIPLPENGNGSWPLQPEPMTPPITRVMPKIEPAAEEQNVPLQPTAETPARPQRDTLAALADELSTRPTPTRSRSPLPTRPQPAEPRVEARTEARTEPRLPPAPPAAVAAPVETAAADQSLADMAHRLEAALRKPSAGPPPAAPRTTSPAEQAAGAEAPAMPPRPARPAEQTKPAARAETKPGKSTTLYDNLEQEMASLLGRPTNKN
jgi:flagellar protein FliO/FliZ